MRELHRFSRPLSAAERSRQIVDESDSHDAVEAVTRSNGELIVIDWFDELLEDTQQRVRAGLWVDRAESDRWLAPRLHHALRLNRSEAADRGIWEWLAVRAHNYVTWRWIGQDGDVVNARWRGPIHKQALARLWWGAEIFRDGIDYRPVERAFIRQDLPNSLLHRPLVRCRSLALGLIEVVAPHDAEPISASAVNDLARALNLATAGSPPEVETGFQRDDVIEYGRWVSAPVGEVDSWDPLPVGPSTTDTTESSRDGGRRIAERGFRFAAQAREA